MAMVFCRGCGKEIHESATTCPGCGAVQLNKKTSNSQGSKWMAIAALILGVLSLLAIFGMLDQGGADPEEAAGIVIFAVASLILATINLIQKKWGKGLAITSIVLSVFSLLILIGS